MADTPGRPSRSESGPSRDAAMELCTKEQRAEPAKTSNYEELSKRRAPNPADIQREVAEELAKAERQVEEARAVQVRLKFTFEQESVTSIKSFFMSDY